MIPSSMRVDDVLSVFDSPIYIGGGAQKQVYSALHQDIGRVAVKIGAYSSASELERISREVGLLKSIDSPYFPKQYFFEPCEGARYYIVEELIDGTSLEQHIGEYTNPRNALELVQHIVTAMSLLWRQRVVHRDIKPANIIIASDHPRIIDLGIARIQDASSLTMSFAPFGPCTPNYASPEQLTNQKRFIDHRADQFALGIVLGQLLLGGGHPFDPLLVSSGNSIPENILLGHWHRKILGDACNNDLFSLLDKMLGTEPYRRFRRYQELADKINYVMGGLQ